jgi:hypothetical protein
VQRFSLKAMPHWHQSSVASQAFRRRETRDGITQEVFVPSYWPGDGVGEHLEFALKYDGVNLALLLLIFNALDPADLAAYVQRKPTGKYARRLWFLFELLTGRLLPLEDLGNLNYVEILPPEDYFVVPQGRRSRRHCVIDNLPGSAAFCPLVRRTELLTTCSAVDHTELVARIVKPYSPELLARAVHYLFTKETRSSFAIERVEPGPKRLLRFVECLQLASRQDFVGHDHLVELQNLIVDERFAEPDYRLDQNYVGETISPTQERIHFVPPGPQFLPELMNGLIAAHLRMAADGLHPVVHAACIAFGFVFLHPFNDGNGRIHRFLLHNILARRGVTPEGLIFPVSAVMVKRPKDYDAALEAFSKPLLEVLDYEVDDRGRLSVHGDPAVWYRFPDLTAQTEALFGFIEATIKEDLLEELQFLETFEKARASVREIVDLPDRDLDLFVRLCLQNQGRLSASKRSSQFKLLTDEEVLLMEQAVQRAILSAPLTLVNAPAGP